MSKSRHELRRMLLPCGFSGEFGDDKILVTVGFLKEHDQVWGAVWNFRA
ncbi:MAG: hypothetical protein JRG94_00575 [Deltaproteobacteria bacterium]|nr:hypothetical protein [Deltaproteobacteria bacterium]